ncbi:MAG: ParA family protein [Candidatus Eisenbacteria bacterium]|uniref:ParA family protein n=1 Tax=Eiseniibacteriota bacterium TaxID=2212470 RepID=A0A7Y2EDA7_UNCEI|nr:ParA family protein [Candidatus Eisenbacteria bacterium]
MSRFVAIANQKGGVGKTTTTINLAASLARLGHRILVLDMDPQGNSSSGLGIQGNHSKKGVYEVLLGQIAFDEAVCPSVFPGIDVLPSGQKLSGAEVELVSFLEREKILSNALLLVRERYDFIFADCPPSLGLLTINTLTAADSVLIPIQSEYYALEGLTQLLNTIQLVQRSLNRELEIEGILLTMFDARLNLSQQVADEARKFFEGRVYDTYIPRNVRLSEAPSFGIPAIQYDEESSGSRSYLALADEFLSRRQKAESETGQAPVETLSEDEGRSRLSEAVAHQPTPLPVSTPKPPEGVPPPARPSEGEAEVENENSGSPSPAGEEIQTNHVQPTKEEVVNHE